MSKQVILTGLRANNDLHIGNYLGAIMPTVDMARQKADEFQVNLFVPDLHSFTTPIDHSQLQAAIMNNVRVYAAAGLPIENDNVNVYRQSYVSAHSELTWILDCFTGFGELSRMTQFKEKGRNLAEEAISRLISTDMYSGLRKYLLKNNPELVSVDIAADNTTVGLFNYPVLMAADILLYDASYVPVGDDQTQHLEFTRDIAVRMNNQLGDLFTVPKAVKEQHVFFGKDQGLRIKDLQDPCKKMSKSDETGKGVIFLSDTPEVARKKIMSAVTDDFALVNYDHKTQPGISNLLDLLALTSGVSIEEVSSKYGGQTMYGPLKKDVADSVCAFLEDFQSKMASLDDSTLIAKLESSETAMNIQANKTLLKVQKAVGLR